MDSFFDESFKHFNSFFDQIAFDVDMYETKTDVVIEAELPGYKRDQIQLEIIDNQVRIAVEDTKLVEEKNEQRMYRNIERSFHRIERLVSLPFTISEKNTRASYKDGILRITTPRRETSRRFIDIDE